MSAKPVEGKVECPIRTKFAKPFNEKKYAPFQLYTKYSKPGLVNIFFNEDKRCFHNWGFEAGPKQKRGRTREAFDHQINAPVMELIGPHDGSVYMVCPPQTRSVMNVDMPLVTILMRDLHGYSSVEFTVLDSMGYSRRISAKNFKSRCTIGELNMEIPMRLSPTWNYACVNLDDALYNAFGTRLTSIQRIKINASARVRRVYFSEEIFPYKTLPQQFRINLSLTPEEKLEIQMCDEFFASEAGYYNAPDQRVPWSLPKLMLGQTGVKSLLDTRYSVNLPSLMHKKKGDIIEVPATELEPEKYGDVKIPDLQTDSNAAVLREMLQKSVPPSKNVLPTLSLIYPDRHDQNSGDDLQTKRIQEYLKSKGGRGKEGTCLVGSYATCPDDSQCFEKLKKCVELDNRYSGEYGGEDDVKPETDWDKINHPQQDQSSHSRHHHQGRHHHHDHHHHLCKLNPKMLAKYLKLREVLGDYDLFNAKVRNPKFLESNRVDTPETEEEGEDYEEYTNSVGSEVVPELTDAAEVKTILSHSHRSQSNDSPSDTKINENGSEEMEG